MKKVEGVIIEWNSTNNKGVISDNQNNKYSFSYSEFRALRRPKIDDEVYFSTTDTVKELGEAWDVQELDFVKKQRELKGEDMLNQTAVTNSPMKKIAVNANVITAVLLVLVALISLGLIVFYFLR